MTQQNEQNSLNTSLTSQSVSRRGFLVGSGAVAFGAVALAACGNDKKDATSDTTEAPADGGGDAKIAAIAASLEFLAVSTYKAGLDAATAGKLGAVPPAVATFAKTAMADHQTALDGWNAVLTSGGAPEASAAPASLQKFVNDEFAKVKDVGGLANLALTLEQTAADTYLSVLPSISDKGAITTAGALQTVSQEHAAILLFVLGKYPVPDVFQGTTKAFKG